MAFVVKKMEILTTEGSHYYLAVRSLMMFDFFLHCLAIFCQARVRIATEKGPIKHGGHAIKTSVILFGTLKEFGEEFGSDVSSPIGFVLPKFDVVIKYGRRRVFVVEIDRFMVAFLWRRGH